MLPVAAALLLSTMGCSAPGAQQSSDLEELPPLFDEHLLALSDQHPEGGTYDAIGRAFYVGSLTYGTVTRVSGQGDESVIFDAEVEGVATLGMKADADRGHLWVCGIDRETKAGTVWRFDLDSDALLGVYDLGETASSASCNDVTVDADGFAYVTDRENPNIYRIDPESDEVVLWTSSELLEPGLVGMNGIAITDDGRTMLVTKYLAPRLYRISMDDPTDVRRVDLKGDALHVWFHPLAGADGIELFDEELYIAFDKKVFRVTPGDEDWTSGHVKRVEGIDHHGGVTTLMEAEGDLFAANGQAPRFVVGLRDPAPAAIWRLGL